MEAEISFATEREVKRLADWRIPRALPQDAGVVRKIYDTVELARLACVRRRYYHRQGLTVRSMGRQVSGRVRTQPQLLPPGMV